MDGCQVNLIQNKKWLYNLNQDFMSENDLSKIKVITYK